MTLFTILLGLYFALVSAYLSIILSRLLKQNGSAIREQGDKLSKLITQMDAGLKSLIKSTQELIGKESQATRELIKELRTH